MPNIALERFWNIHIKSDLTFSIWNYELVIIAITKVRSQIGNLTPNHHYKKSQFFGLNSIFGPFCPFVQNDQNAILEKSFCTCPCWLVSFWPRGHGTFWLVKLTVGQLDHHYLWSNLGHVSSLCYIFKGDMASYVAKKVGKYLHTSYLQL